MPDITLHGPAIFEWIEDGAYLKMSAKMDNPKFPVGLAIFGSDDEDGRLIMLYFDDRKISRKYEFTIEGMQWKRGRDSSDLSQHFTVTISKDGNAMAGEGEMRRDGGEWEGDLSLTYTRVA